MLCHVSWFRVLEAPHEQVPMGDSPEVARAGAGAGVFCPFVFFLVFLSEKHHVQPPMMYWGAASMLYHTMWLFTLEA